MRRYTVLGLWLGMTVMACGPARPPSQPASGEGASGEGPPVVVVPSDASEPVVEESAVEELAVEEPAAKEPDKKVAAAPQEGPAVVGQLAPAVSGKPVSGSGAATIEEARGRVVIVDFWATYCMPCQRSIPHYQKLIDKHGGEVVVIGVSVDDPGDATDKEVEDFVQRNGGRYAVVRDEGMRTAERYMPPKMPSSYIVDRAGVVRHIHGGFSAQSAAQMKEQVEALVKAK